MKKPILILALLLVTVAAGAQSLFVGTYNLRNASPGNGDVEEGNGWQQRKSVVADMINFEHPDIFGTQEALHNQIVDMLALLPDYDYVGVAREDGKEDGEYSAIFYDKNRLKLLRNGNFWLTDKDITKPSLGWDAACIRICSWGEFKDKQSKLRFFYFNLHMDHVGIVARREAAKLVVSKIKEITGEKAPAVLTGDFNVDQTNEIYKIFTESELLSDSYATARYHFAENGTFCDFKSDVKSDSRIDHVFLTPHFKADAYGVLTNAYWTEIETDEMQSDQAPDEISFRRCVRRTPSDHYPVFVKIHYQK